jgi:hypothetical protein
MVAITPPSSEVNFTSKMEAIHPSKPQVTMFKTMFHHNLDHNPCYRKEHHKALQYLQLPITAFMRNTENTKFLLNFVEKIIQDVSVSQEYRCSELPTITALMLHILFLKWYVRILKSFHQLVTSHHLVTSLCNINLSTTFNRNTKRDIMAFYPCSQNITYPYEASEKNRSDKNQNI